MPVTRISDLDELRKVIRSNDRVIVNFGADCCLNCQVMEPIYDKLSNEHSNIVFISVQIDDEGAVMKKYGLRVIPTFKFFEHSVEAGQVTGSIVCALMEGVKMLAAV
ncbi:thioredoxin trx1 [Coemansia sp. RSA 2337]|nr:thioredoxin trx1 [Coemansia sp. S680]KAJ2073488.1 thioredoxin trx1 [Coemansia sp. S100]KAJ2108012.1 thioredoxin trx1 [Coemansia sp. RSA 922]KAJ2344178.1 thioredoxin trx1 [Coemansia sp. RSA 2673]KAJ2466479.1 thioredoxin trx1 [Coemansia sp. RSA 2337]